MKRATLLVACSVNTAYTIRHCSTGCFDYGVALPSTLFLFARRIVLLPSPPHNVLGNSFFPNAHALIASRLYVSTRYSRNYFSSFSLLFSSSFYIGLYTQSYRIDPVTCLSSIQTLNPKTSISSPLYENGKPKMLEKFLSKDKNPNKYSTSFNDEKIKIIFLVIISIFESIID